MDSDLMAAQLFASDGTRTRASPLDAWPSDRVRWLAACAVQNDDPSSCPAAGSEKCP